MSLQLTLDNEQWTESDNEWVAAVISRWPSEDKQAIARAILETASALPEFDADDVRERYPFIQHFRPNCISAMYSALAKAGMIRATGNYRMSDRPARHKSIHRVWHLNCDYNDRLKEGK